MDILSKEEKLDLHATEFKRISDDIIEMSKILGGFHKVNYMLWTVAVSRGESQMIGLDYKRPVIQSKDLIFVEVSEYLEFSILEYRGG